MFDSVGTFSRMFVPFEDGYLYYGSRKSGGKFVTHAEFDTLLAGWRRIAGPLGIMKTAGFMFAAIAVSVAISTYFDLPEGLDGAVTVAVTTPLVAWILWHAFAPRRLVRDREPVAPPRPTAEAMRAARAVVSWRMVIGFGLISGVVFVATLTQPTHEISWWAWLIGSGATFGVYAWVGWKKLRDR